MELTDPRYPRYIWSDKNIKEARAVLTLRYSDILHDELMQKIRDRVPLSQEEKQKVAGAIQELLDFLIEKYRNDPEQIERCIIQHFTKKKK